ncbi:hypothetical protein P9209_18700 [Prescottella defluvii]|nr:hypothetical protein P9209_18700 [Prescottella defluvii]
MPRTRDLLRRFRPAGTPGAAASAGVPADRVAELSAELAPVLSRLDEAGQRAAEIRAAAERDAQAIRVEADERIRARIADADRRVPEERAAAAARASGEPPTTPPGSSNGPSWRRTRSGPAAARIPALVDRIVAALPAPTADGPS